MIRTLLAAICAAALFCNAALCMGKEAAPLGEPLVEGRLKVLAQDLRCLVCQNQTLADSNADLAEDLRNEIRGQIKKGKTDDEIRGYLVDRYGDFILYRPPLKASTWLLWFGPFVMLLIASIVAIVALRRRKARQSPSKPSDARSRVEAWLADID